MRMSNDTAERGYDYTHQSWYAGGVYIACGHPAAMDCGCYGREHAGEPVELGA